jgi:sialic acid synthase SpsE
MIKEDGSVYLVAEIGSNHEGDFEKAKELLFGAASAGVDAVKFQVYTGEALVNKKLIQIE